MFTFISPLWSQSISFGFGDAELEATLNDLNVTAKVDSGGFALEVSTQWGVSTSQVSVAVSTGLTPAEVYVAAFLAKTSWKSLETVTSLYQKNKNAGWGALAKSLGIKPCSKEFKLLKEKSNASMSKIKKPKK